MKKVGMSGVRGVAGAGLMLVALLACQRGGDVKALPVPPDSVPNDARRAASAAGGPGSSEMAIKDDGCRWLAGDFHNHTFLTDGARTPEEVFAHAFEYGLDWIANSEHGGAFARNGNGQSWPEQTAFLGDPPKGMMWRWQSLWHYSFRQVGKAREIWPGKEIFQGYEWNVPAHDHASVAIVGKAEENGLAIARHEYLFDEKDSGTTSGNYLGVDTKKDKMLAKSHKKAVAGVKWLAENYPRNSYFLVNHPSRWQNYTIGSLRDFHDAAPDVAFGFEGMPGHQKASSRGHYDGGPFYDSDGRDVTFKARTYGGADYMLARVGGVWDALLGEGRRFFVFVNSDFHTPEHDFWPGEYAKNHICVRDQDHDGTFSPEELVAGLRSGNSFIAHGGLIDELRFTLSCRQQEGEAEMGGTLDVGGECAPQVTIRFRSPSSNNSGEAVAVDHIDLIGGDVSGRVPRVLADGVTPNPAYEQEDNASAKVVATFTAQDWRGGGGADGETRRVVTYPLPRLARDGYFRLRGANLGRAVENETDAQGNPLSDALLAPNNREKAYGDLWFYSNPVFVRVKR